MRQLPLLAVTFLFPAIAAAHPIVDIAVSIGAPRFAASGASMTYSIRVTDLAYDAANGIVLTDTLPSGAKFTSASGSGWNCSESKGTIDCSAETLTSGVSTITINATAPSHAGTATNKASLLTLGTIDQNSQNDTASADTIVYDAVSCNAAAPLVTGTRWSAVNGATKYRVWTAVEGAKPYVLEETVGTQLDASFETGRNEWWVEAVFASCPPASSAHVQTTSNAPPRPAYLKTVATFDAPASIGIDVYGNVFIADAGDSTIDLIDPNGIPSLLAGMPGSAGNVDGGTSFARFDHPLAIAVGAGGYACVADTGNGSVRFFFPNNTGGFIVGTLMRGLDRPAGIAITPEYTMYVSEGHDVRKLDVTGQLLQTIGPFDSPSGLALDDGGTLYVIDGDTVKRAGNGQTIATSFVHPTAIVFDSLGNLYVADTGANAIRRIAPSGFVTTVVDRGLNAPAGLAFDAAGRLYIADRGGHAVKIVTASPPPDRRRAVNR
jgi:uncharacterized repeat protein (TIGR01451 family)